ncbi:MAG: hypothetical protein JWO42_3761 [Chloroflexi bacterium]|nr:hypothetical protein [Chloroflexota bacterium]
MRIAAFRVGDVLKRAVRKKKQRHYSGYKRAVCAIHARPTCFALLEAGEWFGGS